MEARARSREEDGRLDMRRISWRLEIAGGRREIAWALK
jgi:hypothetical protein